MTKRMQRLLLTLREKVAIMLNGHDEVSRRAWTDLVEAISEEAEK